MDKATQQRMGSSKKHNYGTPRVVLDLMRADGHVIGLDPTTTPSNPVGAKIFATRKGAMVPFDALPRFARGTPGPGLVWERRLTGLTIDWAVMLSAAAVLVGTNRVITFINSPYGLQLRTKFAPKIALEGTRAVCGGQICLVPARVEAEWFRLLMASGPKLRCDWGSPTLGSRLKFVGGKGETAMFPCSFFYWGKYPDWFFAQFAPHGTMIEVPRCALPARRESKQRGAKSPNGVAIERIANRSVASTRGAVGMR